MNSLGDRQADDSSRESEARLKEMMENAPVGIFRSSVEGRFLAANKAMVRIFGYESEADFIASITNIERQVYVAAEKRREIIQAALATDQHVCREIELYRKDGTLLITNLHLRAVRGPHGAVTWLEGFVEDITEKKKALDNLARQKLRLETASRVARVALFGWDAETNILEWSEVVDEMLGYEAGEFPRDLEGWIQSLHPDDRDHTLKYVTGHSEGAGCYQVEYRIRKKDGSYVWWQAAGEGLWSAQGHVLRTYGACIDISEHKRLEAALRSSESLLRTTFDNVPFELWVRDMEGRCIMENDALIRHWGSLLGLRPEDTSISSEELALWRSNNQRAYAGETVDAEVTYLVEGKTRFYQNIIAPIRVEREIRGILGVNIDITERKLLEQQLRQAQKLEAIGTLAGGIAHDFNNILGAIACYAELASRAEPGDPQIRVDLTEVLKGCDRARDLVRQILTFSSQSASERKPIHLEPIIKEGLKLMRATLPATIELSIHIDPGLPQVLADSTQIHQIIVNLCTNATHAMGGQHGSLEVALERFNADPEICASLRDLKPGPHVRLTIKDSGHGMDLETQRRIFEPFFTTKKPGEGSGLGLSVVHGIVRDHQGAIQVYSSPGRGTVMQVYFPALPYAVPESQDPSDSLIRGQNERILFVDDEPALCLTAQRMLQRLDYRVTIQTDPKQALALFRAHPDDYDLVITDLTMPGLIGTELAAALLAIKPGLPIILASGFSGAYTPIRLGELGIRGLIQKPVSIPMLSQVVHQALHFKIS